MNVKNDRQTVLALPEVALRVTATAVRNGTSPPFLILCILLTLSLGVDCVARALASLSALPLVELYAGLFSLSDFTYSLIQSLPNWQLMLKGLCVVALWLFYIACRRQTSPAPLNGATVLLRITVAVQTAFYVIGLAGILLCIGFVVSFRLSAGDAVFQHLLQQVIRMMGWNTIGCTNPDFCVLLVGLIWAGLLALLCINLIGCGCLLRAIGAAKAHCYGRFGKHPIPFFAVLYVMLSPLLRLTFSYPRSLWDQLTLLSAIMMVIAGILGGILLNRHRKLIRRWYTLFTGPLAQFDEDASFDANHQHSPSPSDNAYEESQDSLSSLVDTKAVVTQPLSVGFSDETLPVDPPPALLCGRCGHPFAQNQRFCHNCGRAVRS